MGFVRSRQNVKHHRWLNNPNNAHRICTKCGVRVDTYTKNGVSTYTYTLKDGTKTNVCPDCVNTNY